MRSVIVDLHNATKLEVSEFLTEKYPLQKGPPWLCEVGGDACLYIDFFEELLPVPDTEAGTKRGESLGCGSSIKVVADVSGRHDGQNQVRSLVIALLQRFEGYAQDDYSDHQWTLAELLSGRIVNGQIFFDCSGLAK